MDKEEKFLIDEIVNGSPKWPTEDRKGSAALVYHAKLQAMFETMDAKKFINHGERIMNKDELLRLVIFYSLTVITFVVTCATTLLSWTVRGCVIAEEFLEQQTNKFRS